MFHIAHKSWGTHHAMSPSSFCPHHSLLYDTPYRYVASDCWIYQMPPTLKSFDEIIASSPDADDIGRTPQCRWITKNSNAHHPFGRMPLEAVRARLQFYHNPAYQPCNRAHSHSVATKKQPFAMTSLFEHGQNARRQPRYERCVVLAVTSIRPCDLDRWDQSHFQCKTRPCSCLGMQEAPGMDGSERDEAMRVCSDVVCGCAQELMEADEDYCWRWRDGGLRLRIEQKDFFWRWSSCFLRV